MEWHKMDIGTIIGGIASDNTPYLLSFLIDYKNTFHVEHVNPSCQKCLKEYHNEFIKKYEPMENTSQYRLLKKREGIQLTFGSSIFVNNKNITDDYAEKLIKRFKESNPDFQLKDLFDKYPVTVEKKEVVTEEKAQTAFKKERKKRK